MDVNKIKKIGVTDRISFDSEAQIKAEIKNISRGHTLVIETSCFRKDTNGFYIIPFLEAIKKSNVVLLIDQTVFPSNG